MKQFWTSATNWVPAYDGQAQMPMVQNDGWTDIAKTTGQTVEHIRRTTRAAQSGIIARVGKSNATNHYYISITIRLDTMQALGWRIGDRVRVMMGQDWKSMKIQKEPVGYKLTPSVGKKGVDMTDQCIAAAVKIRITAETAGKIGYDPIMVKLKQCAYDKSGLIARW